MYVQYSTDTGAVRSSGGGPPPTTPVETGGVPMGSGKPARKQNVFRSEGESVGSHLHQRSTGNSFAKKYAAAAAAPPTASVSTALLPRLGLPISIALNHPKTNKASRVAAVE